MAHSWRTLIFTFVLGLPAFAFAGEFSSSYLKFSLPPQWNCQLQDSVWVCRYKEAKACAGQAQISKECRAQVQKSREALIIFTAREASQLDSLSAYLEDLRTSRPLKVTGGSSQSQVVHTKRVKINNQEWIDSLHLSSELPNYYTRYFATKKGNVALLITFSAHKVHYTKYSASFFQAIKTLKVLATRVEQIRKAEVSPKVFSRPIDLPDDIMAEMETLEESSPDQSSGTLFLAALILAVVGLFIWFKSQKRH